MLVDNTLDPSHSFWSVSTWSSIASRLCAFFIDLALNNPGLTTPNAAPPTHASGPPTMNLDWYIAVCRWRKHVLQSLFLDQIWAFVFFSWTRPPSCTKRWFHEQHVHISVDLWVCVRRCIRTLVGEESKHLLSSKSMFSHKHSQKILYLYLSGFYCLAHQKNMPV